MRGSRFAAASVSVLTCVIAVTAKIDAFESYHDPTLNDDGYCATCHPGFGGGRSDALHALHTGGADPVTANCNLCHTGSGRDNPLMVWSIGSGDGNGLGCVGCHGRDYGEKIEANYRGFPTAGKPKASGFGLRKHHLEAGVGVCQDCHADVPQADIFPENVNPPYYARADVDLNGQPLDACSNEDTPNDSDALGLDNDGDHLYEGDDPDCRSTAPDIQLTQTSLDFGTLSIGETRALSVEVLNQGTADLDVDFVQRCTVTSPEYSWSPDMPFTVTPGGSQTLTVIYTPVDEGVDMGCLEISSNDPAEPTVELGLTGTGIPAPIPDLRVVPASLDFGAVFVGDAVTLTAEVENLGTAELIVSAVLLCVGTSAEFSWVPEAPFTVAAGGSDTLVVTYVPRDASLDRGCLEIQSNDPDEPAVELVVTGSGTPTPEPDISLGPAALDFASVAIGDTVTLTAEVENLGTAELIVSAVLLCVGTSAEFSWVPEAPFTVAAGGSDTLVVTYVPRDASLDRGCLEIQSNDPDEPTVELVVTGSGTPTPEPDISLGPAALDFASVAIGDTVTLTAEVENLGTAELIVSAVLLCVGTSAEFSWVPEAPFTVAAGGSETVSIMYSPRDSSLDRGCLEIQSNDPDEPAVELVLTGSGVLMEPEIVLNPASLDFGEAFVGDTATVSVEVRNAGSEELVVTAIEPCEGLSPEFNWVPDAPYTIAPGEIQKVTFSYAPVDVGLDEGCVSVVSNDPDTPTFELGLRGAGREPVIDAPVVVLEPDSLDFSTVVMGEALQLTTEVSNQGTRDLVVSEVRSCEGTSMEFSWAPDAPFTVSPGAVQALTVTYAPEDVGVDDGCLAVVNNDPERPLLELALSGNGADSQARFVDLDIAKFSATRQVRLQGGQVVKLKLSLSSPEIGEEPRPATVVGVQNEMEVYKETLMVSAPLSGGRRQIDFPAFEPVDLGDIAWTATVTDDDPDLDRATAATRVLSPGGKNRGGGPVDPALLGLLGLGFLVHRGVRTARRRRIEVRPATGALGGPGASRRARRSRGRRGAAGAQSRRVRGS